MKCIKTGKEPKIKPVIILKKWKLLMQQTSSVAHKSRCFPYVSLLWADRTKKNKIKQVA